MSSLPVFLFFTYFQLNVLWPYYQKDMHAWLFHDFHIHGLVYYVKDGPPFSWDLSLENSVDSYVYFQLVLLDLVLYFCSLYQSPSSYLFTVFNSISSNIDEFLLTNPTANVSFFGGIHHKDWVTYSGGTDRPGGTELCCNVALLR